MSSSTTLELSGPSTPVSPVRPVTVDHPGRYAEGTEYAAGTRLRARPVDETHFALRAAVAAVVADKPRVKAAHGGTVANAYRYPAYTEGVVATAGPDGRACVWFARVPANKTTLSGVARYCIPEAADLFDGRTGEDRRAVAMAFTVAAHVRAVDVGDTFLHVRLDPPLRDAIRGGMPPYALADWVGEWYGVEVPDGPDRESVERIVLWLAGRALKRA